MDCLHEHVVFIHRRINRRVSNSHTSSRVIFISEDSIQLIAFQGFRCACILLDADS